MRRPRLCFLRRESRTPTNELFLTYYTRDPQRLREKGPRLSRMALLVGALLVGGSLMAMIF